MTKVLAFRIWSVAQYVVQQEKTGFVQGRFIRDTMISSWEAPWSGLETGQQSLFLKIDFEKACDQVDSISFQRC